jgi:hypothetical protein
LNMKNSHKMFEAKTRRKETTWEHKRTWEDNIKVNIRETGYGDVYRIHMA